MNLERWLDQTLTDASCALAAMKEVAKCLKRFRTAAHLGVMKEIPRAIESAQQATVRLQEAIDKAHKRCVVDDPFSWNGSACLHEIVEMAREKGVELYLQDEYLYCFPSLVKVLPNDSIVMIDKAREKRVRPSVLVEHLKKLQEKPPRFRPQAFLESLYDAYQTAVKTRPRDKRGQNPLIPLVDVYDLFTLLPDMKREYSRHEFARDLYLLDTSDVHRTRDGVALHLHPARGTEPERKVFPTVARDGRLLRYYAISFA